MSHSKRNLPTKKNFLQQQKIAAIEQQVVSNLIRNGITTEDLKKNWQLGYNQGVTDGLANQERIVFSAFLIALRKEFGWGTQRALRICRAAHEECLNFITEPDASEQLWKDLRIVYDGNDPFDPYNEKKGE